VDAAASRRGAWPGREPGGGTCALYKGCVRMPEKREAGQRGGRRRCAVRTGAEMRPICIALRGGPSRVVPTEIRSAPRVVQPDAPRGHRRRWHPWGYVPAGESTKQADSPSRAERRTTRRFRGDSLVCFLHFAHEAADASGVRRSARPLSEGGAGNSHTSGASAPRDRGRLCPMLSFRGASGASRMRTRNPEMAETPSASHVGIPRHSNRSG